MKVDVTPDGGWRRLFFQCAVNFLFQLIRVFFQVAPKFLHMIKSKFNGTEVCLKAQSRGNGAICERGVGARCGVYPAMFSRAP